MLFNRENGRHIDTNDTKEALKFINTLGLDNTVKSKPVLGVDDLLLLLNYHWARNTSTFPTEQHRVGFALILLLLFGTRYRPAELVDRRKKRRDKVDSEDDDLKVVDNDDILGADKSDAGFETENNDFSGRNDGARQGVREEDIRQFDAICYEDVRLLVVWSSGSGERDVLAIEITIAHHKGHKRRPKPQYSSLRK